MVRDETPGALRALGLATLAFFTCFYVWSLFGPLSPAIQHDLKLTEVEVGWLVAVPVVLGSLMRVAMGVLTDRYGARRVFPALMAFSSLPLFAIAIWHASFGTLIGFGFLLGFAGSSFAIGVPYVSRWFTKERQGFALGIYGMGMGGTVLTALTAPTIVQRWGMSTMFAIAALIVLLVGAIFLVAAKEPPVPRPAIVSFLAPFRVFTTEWRAWALTVFYFLAFGGFVAMYLYLPKLLTGVYGLTKADAGARAAGFALLAVLARPIGGYLSDRIGARRVLLVCFAGTTLFAAGLAAGYSQIVALTICCLSMAVMFGLGTGAVFKLVALEFPSQVGAVTGVVGAAGGLGGFFPPLVMAFVKSITGSYTLGFILLSLTAAVCLLILWRLGSSATRTQAAQTRPAVLT
jgi:NNP family nitrate/nitrite transporter-like MFS transporter